MSVSLQSCKTPSPAALEASLAARNEYRCSRYCVDTPWTCLSRLVQVLSTCDASSWDVLTPIMRRACLHCVADMQRGHVRMQADAPSSSSLDNGGATCNGSAAVAQDEAHASHRRALVFSPHPDDDVISMGGTLARLCQQGAGGRACFSLSRCCYVRYC